MANFDFKMVNDPGGNDDLYIDPEQGDFAIAPSDEQHIKDTINAFPGWWKQYPADGVGAWSYSGSSGQAQSLVRSIKLQLQSDGYQVNNPQVSFIGGSLIINPDATTV